MFGLMPKGNNFFDLFDKQASLAVEAARFLSNCANPVSSMMTISRKCAISNMMEIS